MQLKRKRSIARPAKAKKRKPTRQAYPTWPIHPRFGPKLYSAPRSLYCTRLPFITGWVSHAAKAPPSSSFQAFSAPIFISRNFMPGSGASVTGPTFSGIGINAECPNLLIQRRLNQTIEKALADTGRKIHLIGHSLGGVIARSLAGERPKDVASVITLAAPVRGTVANRACLMPPKLFAFESSRNMAAEYCPTAIPVGAPAIFWVRSAARFLILCSKLRSIRGRTASSTGAIA